jgi:hypothetical protein
MSISEKTIFEVDSLKNRGIIRQNVKAVTKTGAQASRPRERPLAL